MKDIGLHILPIWLNLGIAMSIFAYALRADRDDIRFVKRERRLVGLSLLSIFVVTPAIAIAVVEWIDMPPRVKLAIVALSFSIIAPALPHKVGQGAHRPYANALTLTVAALSIPVVPLLVDLMGRVTNHPYGISPGEIAGYVGTVLAVPLVLGLLFRWRWSDRGERLSRPLTRFAFMFTAVAIAIEVALSLPAIWHLLAVGTVLGMALFTAATIATGHLMGGPRPGDEMVLALSSATRHPAIALTVVTVNYPEARFSSALMLCLIVNAAVTAVYVRWQRRRIVASSA
jgi:BASS family bile acid:Na+ symporter